jgi:predicted RNA-binding Zn-ribbon protein involved in translation (DUF1610 family)
MAKHHWIALCYSYECTNSLTASVCGKEVVVENRDTFECPKCGHALFWLRLLKGKTYKDYLEDRPGSLGREKIPSEWEF